VTFHNPKPTWGIGWPELSLIEGTAIVKVVTVWSFVTEIERVGQVDIPLGIIYKSGK
jgi:hypothetical protein